MIHWFRDRKNGLRPSIKRKTGSIFRDSYLDRQQLPIFLGKRTRTTVLVRIKEVRFMFILDLDQTIEKK